ncbi:MAG TPA: cytochrome c, partial [Caulobacteraceae bacterium]|nr:cytochrome c [Caulobacteraceae bacterium]
MRWFWTLTISLAAMLGASSVLHAQDAPQSIWSGVYTAAQADRGKAVYSAACSRCHAETLDGNDEVPPVKGSHFMTNWDAQSVADLVQRIRNTMPLDDPGSLSGASTTDLVAYLLQQNGAPAGSNELPSDSGVQSLIHITAQAPPGAGAAPAPAPQAAAPASDGMAPVNAPLANYARSDTFLKLPPGRHM